MRPVFSVMLESILIDNGALTNFCNQIIAEFAVEGGHAPSFTLWSGPFNSSTQANIFPG